MFEKQVEYVFEASLGENDRAWLGGTFLGLKVSMLGIGLFETLNQVCLAKGLTRSVAPGCLSWELTGLSLLNNRGATASQLRHVYFGILHRLRGHAGCILLAKNDGSRLRSSFNQSAPAP